MYTIRDKSSNHILGYAIMYTDRSVFAEEIKLESITRPGVEVHLQEGPVADVPPPIPPGANDNMLIPSSFVSDLDLSQDSSDSMNKTVEEDLSPISFDENDESAGQIRTDKCADIPQSVYSSISPSPPVILDYSPSPAIIQSPLTPSTLSSPVSSTKSPPAVLAPNSFYSTHTAQNIKQEAPSEIKTFTQSLASDIVENVKDQAKYSQATSGSNEVSVSHGKRKLEDDVDERQKMKIAVDKRLERASRERRNHRVKFLLCTDGRLLSLGNFSRHIKAIHELPVPCEICGQVFSGEQLRTHRNKKKCVWQKLEFVDKPASFSLGRSKGLVETSPFPSPTERHQDEALDKSTSSVATHAREMSAGHTVQIEDEISRGVIDQSPATNTNQVTRPSKSESEGGEWVFITLAHDSLDKYISSFKIEKHFKVNKLMKTFGKEHKIEYKKHLRFCIGSEELTGDEKIGELKLNRGQIDDLKKNGGEIEVFGEIVNL